MAVRIIISPAKKMRQDSDSLAWRNLPAHLEQTQQLCQVLQGMSYDQLKKLWSGTAPNHGLAPQPHSRHPQL